MSGTQRREILQKTILISLFSISFLLSFSLFTPDILSNQTSKVDTAVGEFSPSFFKMSHKKKMWMGFSTPVKPNSEYIVEEPVVPIEGREDWPVFKYRSNSDGIRDEEIPKKKPEEEFRILVLGNSMTMGGFVNESKRFTDLLEDRLNKESVQQEYRVINAGTPSAGMFDHYLFLKTIGKEYNPDLVIVDFIWSSDISRVENRKRTITVEELAETREVSRQADTKIMFAYTEDLEWNDSDVRRYGNRLIEFSRQNEIQPLFLTTVFDEKERMENYKRWTEKKNVPLITPPEEFQENPSEVYKFVDGHYKNQGHKWISDRIYTDLSPLIDDMHG